MKTNPSKSEDKKSETSELESIRHKDESAITRIYEQYRSHFLKFSKLNYGIENSLAAELYQESFIALYQNIQEGKLTHLTASLKTYLFKIGTHKILNHKRLQANHRSENIDDYANIISETDSSHWLQKQEIAYIVVSTMPEPCNTVLNLYYWEQKSMAEIANVLKYKNEQVAKNRKSLCLKKLKEYLTTKFRSEELL